MGYGAVYYAVIVGERQVDHAANGYRVVNYYGALFDCAEAENRDVWLIDYWEAEQAAEDAGVGDGEGAFGDFVGLELFCAGALCEIVHGAGDAQEIFLLGVLDNRDDQAPVERDGDADVALLVQDDVGAVNRGVHGGKGAQGFHGSADEEGHEGELGAAGFFKLRFHFGPQRSNGRHIRFVHGIDVRGDVLREDHVLGDALAHDGHRLDFVVAEIHFFARDGVFEDSRGACAACGRRNSCWPSRWCGRCGRRSCAGRRWRATALHGAENVALADAAAGAGAGNLGDINIIFARDFADERRAANFFTARSSLRRSRCSRSRSWRSGLRCCRRRGGLGGFGFRRSRGWRGTGGAVAGFDHGDDGLNWHRLAFADFDFFQHPSRGRGNFRVDFIGGNFEQRFVALDFVSGLFQPLGYRAFKNTFAHLGHDDVNSHGLLL